MIGSSIQFSDLDVPLKEPQGDIENFRMMSNAEDLDYISVKGAHSPVFHLRAAPKGFF